MLFRPNVAKMASRRDASGLVKALAHRDPTIRAAAAEALGDLGGFDATTSLLWAALTDREAQVHEAAARAFQRVGKLKDVLEQGFLFAEGTIRLGSLTSTSTRIGRRSRNGRASRSRSCSGWGSRRGDRSRRTARQGLAGARERREAPL